MIYVSDRSHWFLLHGAVLLPGVRYKIAAIWMLYAAKVFGIWRALSVLIRVFSALSTLDSHRGCAHYEEEVIYGMELGFLVPSLFFEGGGSSAVPTHMWREKFLLQQLRKSGSFVHTLLASYWSDFFFSPEAAQERETSATDDEFNHYFRKISDMKK